MKIRRRLFNIILIFLVIQAISMAFVSHKIYAESFFDKVFHNGKQWKQLGETNSQALVNNSTALTNATDDIYNAVRAIGIGIFMVNIAFTAITLSNKNNGKDIAGAKATIAFTAILALLFVFAQNIMGFITKLLGDLEGLM